MDDALANLEKNLTSTDIEHTIKLLDIIEERSKNLDRAELQKYKLDFHIKKLLRRNPCIEIIEKIEDLFHLIHDPRNFYDELVGLLESKSLTLPGLMLIHQIKASFNFPYDGFFNKLEEILTHENVRSEGFLFFVLRCLNQPQIDLGIIRSFLTKLAKLSSDVPSEISIRLVYCLLVVMRIHPAAFQFTPNLKELTVLVRSVGPIRAIVQRIFIESKRPERRPKTIFLQNFIFPALFTDERLNDE